MCLHLVGKRSLLQGVKKHLFFNARASFTLTGDASYFFLGGEYFSAKEYLGNNQSVLKEIYQHFGMRWPSPEKTFTHSIAIRLEIVPKDEDGMLVNPSDILWEQVILMILYNRSCVNVCLSRKCLLSVFKGFCCFSCL